VLLLQFPGKLHGLFAGQVDIEGQVAGVDKKQPQSDSAAQ